MDSPFIIKILNQKLKERNPQTFSSSWIIKNTPKIYRYIQKNIRTENNHIDWDKVTSSLDKTFQKRWIRYKYKKVKSYESQIEVDVILDKYKNKLYTFFCQSNEDDKKIQQTMLISLIRIGQKGNIRAQQELVKWITFITDDWIDRYPKMYRWRGYEDEVVDKIKNCIRLYRYTGNFIGYLYKTLEYSVRGKPPLCSLNDKTFYGDRTIEEFSVLADDWQI
jgi:hypothetical protein